MRFLIDESCDAAVVKALRVAGHDVLAVCEEFPGADDRRVISIATEQGRILVTEDKDFGQLVFAAGRGHCGVVLLRYPFPLAAVVASRLVDFVMEHGGDLEKSFVVLQPGKARVLIPPPVA